jgi:hypothetical protein
MSKQYHFVIGYDDTSMKWFVESDTTAYFSDGNLWDTEQYERHFYGWKVPEGEEEELDMQLLRTLQYVIDTLPSPQLENANG